MRRLLQTNLFLSSVLALILCACSPVSGYKLAGTSLIREQVRPIVNKNNSLLYKAQIDLYNKHYSGLILLKQTEPGTSHLTFVTEIGMKMFDFEIRDTTFKLVYVFEPLNQTRITTLLESDMKLILLYNLLSREARRYKKKNKAAYKIKDGYRYYYKMSADTNTVEKILVKGSLFTKKKVSYLYNADLTARQIRLKHKGLVRLKIELNNLNKARE